MSCKHEMKDFRCVKCGMESDDVQREMETVDIKADKTMKDSLQKISQETLLTLMDEQTKQVKVTGKKPSFKQLIADAIEKCYK